jgi:hypothetical protein
MSAVCVDCMLSCLPCSGLWKDVSSISGTCLLVTPSSCQLTSGLCGTALLLQPEIKIRSVTGDFHYVVSSSYHIFWLLSPNTGILYTDGVFDKVVNTVHVSYGAMLLLASEAHFGHVMSLTTRQQCMLISCCLRQTVWALYTFSFFFRSLFLCLLISTIHYL